MPMTNRYYVYLVTNWNNRVMYLGVSNNVKRRLYEHKNKFVKGFTEKIQGEQAGLFSRNVRCNRCYLPEKKK